jgi:glutathione S-transferase
MLTLYGVYQSRASRPLWLLAEADVPFVHVPVIQAYRLADPTAPDAPLNSRSPAYLAINPQGQVPALDDDGLILTESLAITFHLARKYGGSLGPANPAEEALMLQWTLFAATALEPDTIAIYLSEQPPRAGTPEAIAARAAAAGRLHAPLARLDAHLGAQDHLVGGRFTVADIVVAECVRYAQADTGLMDHFPGVATWLTRCHARSGFRQMWARRLAE